MMTDGSPASHQPATKDELDAVTIGGARPHGGPIKLAEYDDQWPTLFAREAARIRVALGSGALHLEHVGSTSVPGLAAKPIIDIVLEVADSSIETDYVPALEAQGYVLRIREPDWWEHRMLKGPDAEVNLHAFTVGCPEVARMVRFRDHLRTHAADRELYCVRKRELAARNWEFVQNYANAKTEVIEQINARALAGDPKPA